MPVIGRRPTLMQQGGAVTGHSQDRQRIRYSPAALWQVAPPPDAIVQRQSADIKRVPVRHFYSRQRVTPIVDKIDKFASRHQPIEQTFLRGPVIKASSFATQVL